MYLPFMKNKVKISSLALFGVLALSFAPSVSAETDVVKNFINDEKIVREYFKDIPTMIEIARCESKYRQFTDAGNPLIGGDGVTVGVFQVHESIHSPVAARLGHDLRTIEGNMAYAQHLYELEGSSPWNSSKYCWEMPAKDAEVKLKTKVTDNKDKDDKKDQKEVVTEKKDQVKISEVKIEKGDSQEIIALKTKINLLTQLLQLLVLQKQLAK